MTKNWIPYPFEDMVIGKLYWVVGVGPARYERKHGRALVMERPGNYVRYYAGKDQISGPLTKEHMTNFISSGRTRLPWSDEHIALLEQWMKECGL